MSSKPGTLFKSHNNLLSAAKEIADDMVPHGDLAPVEYGSYAYGDMLNEVCKDLGLSDMKDQVDKLVLRVLAERGAPRGYLSEDSKESF